MVWDSEQWNAEEISSPERDDYIVYRLIESASRKSVYIGVVLSRQYRKRFFRHYTDDVRSPWHAHQWPADIYQGSCEQWPYRPDIIEHLNGFTRLEALAAQQYWWEKYCGAKGLLKNGQQPLPRSRFIVLRGKGCWDGYLKGFPNGWVPIV